MANLLSLLYLDQHGRCYYCGRECDKARKAAGRVNAFTQDHMLPLSLGGADDRTNKVGCCFSCNHRKGMMRLDEWRASFLNGVFYGELQGWDKRWSKSGVGLGRVIVQCTKCSWMGELSELSAVSLNNKLLRVCKCGCRSFTVRWEIAPSPEKEGYVSGNFASD